MDVHVDNWRFLGQTHPLIVHLVLPQPFLRANGLTLAEDTSFFAQTRLFHNFQCLPYTRVWAKVTEHPRALGGWAISVPIHVQEGSVNPLNVLTLKIHSLKDKKVSFVHFFYLSLLRKYFSKQIFPQQSGPRDNCPSTPSTQDTNSTPGATSAVNPLEHILSCVQTQGTKATPGTALGFLSSLLQSVETQPRHHQALEAPGEVRGSKEAAVPQPQPQVDAAPKLTFNGPLGSLEPSLWERVGHVMSQSWYYVCMYDSLPNLLSEPLISSLDLMSLEELYGVSPIRVIADDIYTLAAVQDQLVDSLEQHCLKSGGIIHQAFPVTLPKIPDLFHTLKDHFLEACIVLRNTTDETSAWVKAAVYAHMGYKGVWADFLQLWGAGPPCLGAKISTIPPSLLDSDIKDPAYCSALLQDPGVLSSTQTAACACLIVNHHLSAWLVLPGGFAIKGRYHIAPEVLVTLVARWLTSERVSKLF